MIGNKTENRCYRTKEMLVQMLIDDIDDYVDGFFDDDFPIYYEIHDTVTLEEINYVLEHYKNSKYIFEHKQNYFKINKNECR